MSEAMRVGIIGDFDPSSTYHHATTEALHHAAAAQGLAIEVQWLQGRRGLETCDGLWAAPGSPYRSFEGALAGIRFARERGRPFAGT
jgi:CTP synthase (UTP-ammonia lyase)